MQCIIKLGSSSLHTIAGAKDVEGGYTHQLLLSALAYIAVPTAARLLYTGLVSMLSLQLETYLSIADCWSDLTGLLLTHLTYQMHVLNI